ncbi:hypothetical protein V4331_08480 [Lactococcus formosensis subsp. formosensis]|uniref:hypothetical protein n=1 Tax=Lactococcus formosensis TaxID=1281486 RepID=UPI0031331D1E
MKLHIDFRRRIYDRKKSNQEETVGIEQVVELSEQEISDVVLPETPAEEVVEGKESEDTIERSVKEAPTPFEAPQKFEEPRFFEGGLTRFEGSAITPLNVELD